MFSFGKEGALSFKIGFEGGQVHHRGSASICPKSGLMVASSVKLLLTPILASTLRVAEKKNRRWGFRKWPYLWSAYPIHRGHFHPAVSLQPIDPRVALRTCTRDRCHRWPRGSSGFLLRAADEAPGVQPPDLFGCRTIAQLAQRNFHFSRPGRIFIAHFAVPDGIPVYIPAIIHHQYIDLLTRGGEIEFKSRAVIEIAVKLQFPQYPRKAVAAAETAGDLFISS